MGETNNADIKIIKRILNFYPILRYLDDSDSSEAYSSSPITSHTIWTTSLLEFMLGSPSHELSSDSIFPTFNRLSEGNTMYDT